MKLHSSSVYIQEDHLIRMILLTHHPDPDGPQLDCIHLLQAIEKIIHYSTIQNVFGNESLHKHTEAFGLQETIGGAMYNIAYQIFEISFEDGDLHTKTMCLFEMLGHFEWDAKVVLVLMALALKYGQCQLISNLRDLNRMASSVAVLMQLPCDLTTVKRQFKALIMLMKTMVELTKLVVEFENLPLKYELLEFRDILIAKSLIYMAIYWCFRSSLASFSLLTGLPTRKYNQVEHVSPAETWILYSLVHKLSCLCSKLREQVDACKEKTDLRLYKKLVNDASMSDLDNQEKLKMLISSRHRFPLKDCLSKDKHSISELKDKVVILLLSKQEFIPMDKIFFLVKQTHDHPYNNKIKNKYVILWIPTSSSCTWNQADEKSFHFLSNVLPFWTVRQPWLMNSSVVKFIRQEWDFQEEAKMVVLDNQGKVTNLNAMHMVWIWGAKAFPFSRTREKELWQMEKWNLQLILHGIDLSLTSWLVESKNLCIYASDNLDWIKKFTAQMKEIKDTGLQLEVIYIGWKNPSERLKHIVDIIETETRTLSSFHSFRNICCFWHRLESMKNSILNLENADSCNDILKEIKGLLDTENCDEGWMIIGTGDATEMIKLEGSKIQECFDLFPVWVENVGDFGLVGAIKNAIEPRRLHRHCCGTQIVPYKEDIVKDRVICEECKCHMQKFLVYKCEET